MATTFVVLACGPAAPPASPGASGGTRPSPLAAGPSATAGRDIEFADVPFMRGNAARTSEVPGPGPIASPLVAWDVPIGDEPTLNPIIVDGLVLTGGPSTVVAIDARTGTIAWQRPLPGRLEGTLGAADGIAVAASSNTVSGLDVATGDVRWSISMDTSAQRPEIVDGVAYLGTTDGLVVGLDVASGKTVWSWQGPRGVVMRADLVADGVVYVSSTDGRLFTIAIADKAEGWTFQAPTIRINPSWVGDTIFVSSALQEQEHPEGQVAAIDRATGKVRWRFFPPNGDQAIHGAVHDGVLLVTTRGDGAYGLSATDGSVVWRNTEVPVTDWSSILSGDVVYVLTRSGAVWGLDAGTGRTLWHVENEGNTRGPIVSGGLVIVTLGPPGRVIAYGEPARVAALPIASAPASDGPTAPPLRPNPLTVVRTFDPATTHVDVGDRSRGPEGTQAAFGPDGMLYVIDNESVVSVLDPATGRRLRTWGGPGHGDGKFDGPHDITVGKDGTVYVADAGNHRIQVFEPSGAFLRQIGSFGTNLGQFATPTGVVSAPDGSLFVMDATAITRFAPTGDVDWRVGGASDPDLRFRTAYDLAVLDDGRVLVALDPGGSLLVLDPGDGSIVGSWGPADIAASPEPVVAPDGRVWMFQYVSERIDVFEPDGTRIGTMDMEGRDAAMGQLYPTPVTGPNGHAYTFNERLGLVELAVDLPAS